MKSCTGAVENMEIDTVDDAMRDLLPDEQDLEYEEELLRNPYNLRLWLRYLEARRDAPLKRRFVLYERALHALPGSYKVWWFVENMRMKRQVGERG